MLKGERHTNVEVHKTWVTWVLAILKGGGQKCSPFERGHAKVGKDPRFSYFVGTPPPLPSLINDWSLVSIDFVSRVILIWEGGRLAQVFNGSWINK